MLNQKPFAYEFLDFTKDRQYLSDEQFAIVIGFFTSLVLIIAITVAGQSLKVAKANPIDSLRYE